MLARTFARIRAGKKKSGPLPSSTKLQSIPRSFESPIVRGDGDRPIEKQTAFKTPLPPPEEQQSKEAEEEDESEDQRELALVTAFGHSQSVGLGSSSSASFFLRLLSPSLARDRTWQ